MHAYLQGIVAKELLYVKDVTFQYDPYASLNAPLTEFALLTAKDGADLEAFRKKVTKLVQDVIDLKPKGNVAQAGTGVVRQSEREFINMFGWESVEVRGRSR